MTKEEKEKKNMAILACGDDYDELLEIQYGPKGTPTRDQFDRDAEAFILAERLKEERKKAGANNHAASLRKSLAPAFKALALVNIQHDLVFAVPTPDRQVYRPGLGVDPHEPLVAAADGANEKPISYRQ